MSKEVLFSHSVHNALAQILVDLNKAQNQIVQLAETIGVTEEEWDDDDSPRVDKLNDLEVSINDIGLLVSDVVEHLKKWTTEDIEQFKLVGDDLVLAAAEMDKDFAEMAHASDQLDAYLASLGFGGDDGEDEEAA